MDFKIKKQSINFITLGCSKNWVDTEVLMRQFDENFKVEHNAETLDFDIIIINTCGFIADAKEESINTILFYNKAKEEDKIKQLIVMGCLSERYKSDLKIEIPEVDAFFGVDDFKGIVNYLKTNYKTQLLEERILTTPSHFAYLKISEGCDRTCAFCAIPLIRGKHISKPIENIVSEANFLAKKGVKELILIAQDLSYYGVDLYKKQKLNELLEALVKIEGIVWIRLHYAYPANFPKSVLQIMRKNDKICNYLDIPFQHISDNMLKNMKRGHNKKNSCDLINFFKKEVPNIALRTTILVGYPNETEEDFEELKTFVKEVAFDRLGVFTYSEEEDTYSAKNFEDNIPEEIKQERASEIMNIQQEIAFSKNQEKIGQTLKVLIDRKEEDFFVGRTEFDSPEIDNEVLIEITNEIEIGNFYDIKITRAEEFDLFGTKI